MNTNTNTQKTAERPDFEQVKRNYETALASGKDSTQELTALATAVAYSVLNKCIDPQRKTAADRETVSDNGYNPALVQLKRGIAADLATLDNLRTATNKATRTAYNADGDLTTETVDKDAEKAAAALIGETLSDGIDLVNAAALAILEQAAEHADPAAPWLDTPYPVRLAFSAVRVGLSAVSTCPFCAMASRGVVMVFLPPVLAAHRCSRFI